jgi:hypothetical protein
MARVETHPVDRPRERGRASSGSRAWLLAPLAAAIGLAAGLVLCEGLLRLADRPAPPIIGWTGGKPDEKNEFGFRGHHVDARADVRILLLGDSQVEAANTPFDEMPEIQLRRAVARGTRAGVGVATIGSGGWGQDQELLALARYVEQMRPTVVVLWFTAGNDLWNNTFPTHFPRNGWPKPTFWLERGELRGPNVPLLASYRPPGLYLTQAVRRLRRLPNYPTDEEWERHLPPPYQPIALREPAPALAEWIAERRGVRVDQLPYFNEENFDTEKTHASIYLVPESPRLKYSADLTRALLLRIWDVCKAHDARFFVLYTVGWDLYPEEATVFDVRGKGFALSTASARRLIDRVLDGLPTIRVENLPAEAVVSKTDRHLNGEGNAYVMEALARDLLRALPEIATASRR